MRSRLLLVLAVMLLALVLPAAAAAQASSPPSGQIAFVRGGDIWTMNTDGSGQRQLSAMGKAEQPAWSPNGARIAFLRATNPTTLWVMSADGSNARRVPFKLGAQQMPWHPGGKLSYWFEAVTWTPDGKYLTVGATAFSQGDTMAASYWARRLFRVRPDGSGQRAISPVDPDRKYQVGIVRHLSWRPDGKRILVTTWMRSATEVTEFNTATQRYARPFSKLHLGYAVWSPAGGRIVACHPEGWGTPGRARLVVIDMYSYKRHVIMRTDEAIGDPSHLYATWSPDGRWIACAVTEYDYGVDEFKTGLLLLSADGGDSQVVSADAAQPAWRPR